MVQKNISVKIYVKFIQNNKALNIRLENLKFACSSPSTSNRDEPYQIENLKKWVVKGQKRQEHFQINCLTQTCETKVTFVQ